MEQHTTEWRCRTKIPHPTKRHAIDHIVNLKTSKKVGKRRRGNLQAYKCEHCDQWHVGHPMTQSKLKKLATVVEMQDLSSSSS